jgi:hypothetical protein
MLTLQVPSPIIEIRRYRSQCWYSRLTLISDLACPHQNCRGQSLVSSIPNDTYTDRYSQDDSADTRWKGGVEIAKGSDQGEWDWMFMVGCPGDSRSYFCWQL